VYKAIYLLSSLLIGGLCPEKRKIFFSDSQRSFVDLAHNVLDMQNLPTDAHSLLCREYNILWMVIVSVNPKTSDKFIVIAITGRAGPVSSKKNKECNSSTRQVLQMETSQFYIFLPEQFFL